MIGLVGVCLKPKAMLVLEYAELGCLTSMKPYRSLNTQLKHRVALQVCACVCEHVCVCVCEHVCVCVCEHVCV